MVRGRWFLALRAHPGPCPARAQRACSPGRVPSLRPAGHGPRHQRLVHSHVVTGPASAVILFDDLNYGYSAPAG